MRHSLTMVLCAACFLLASCATVGKPFPVGPIKQIAIGETTKEDMRTQFGEPWRTGIEDGHTTWTYGHYRYSLFAPAKTRDLVVRFDDEGKVRSYSFNSTYAEDRR